MVSEDSVFDDLKSPNTITTCSIAGLLIDKKVTKFDPSKLEDTYEDTDRHDRRQAQGQEAADAGAKAQGKCVVDLVSVLKKSLANEGIKPTSKKPARKSA